MKMPNSLFYSLSSFPVRMRIMRIALGCPALVRYRVFYLRNWELVVGYLRMLQMLRSGEPLGHGFGESQVQGEHLEVSVFSTQASTAIFPLT